MYSYEERLRAVELYIKLGKRPKAVIRQLGYPTKNSLRAWHEVFQKSGDLHASSVPRKPKYSDEQKIVAIEHYIKHGRCFSFTRKVLGYPSRKMMMDWVHERHPELKKHVTAATDVGSIAQEAMRGIVFQTIDTIIVPIARSG